MKGCDVGKKSFRLRSQWTSNAWCARMIKAVQSPRSKFWGDFTAEYEEGGSRLEAGCRSAMKCTLLPQDRRMPSQGYTRIKQSGLWPGFCMQSLGTSKHYSSSMALCWSVSGGCHHASRIISSNPCLTWHFAETITYTKYVSYLSWYSYYGCIGLVASGLVRAGTKTWLG